MRRFGYLEQGRPDSETLYTEEAVVDAIKLVQKFGAINETGVLDEPTKEVRHAKDILRYYTRRKCFVSLLYVCWKSFVTRSQSFVIHPEK